ncbi:phosphoesterase PA-phosphatase [Paenibacillus yonginensis]|uniref:Phosphoesterase PA-phosphatase n=2 Tax=Paenibacillus yonginensis TaxID=1462996 RepID=A0A1B1N738_9BACL|nr:phosphoesterase PA-phosphatase [Paenibacillus yonginensis]
MYFISGLTVLMTAILIYVGTGRNPLIAAYRFIYELFHSWRFLLVFIAMCCVLVVNKYELKLESLMPARSNYTSVFFGIEGHFVRHFQQFFHHLWVSQISAFFYVIILQSLLVASIGIYAGQRNKIFLFASCYTVLLNYAVAIPFFLFLPINEVWSYTPAGVTFYMLEAFPKFEEVYRPLSGLDNCFPSLHTAISVSMAILAVRSGNRRWAAIACTSAVIIIFSIFYMGIHWLTDMLGGLLLAAISTTIAVYWASRTVRYAEAKPMLLQQR